MFNIYCDESCHLEHDNSDIMTMGGICCNKNDTKELAESIRNIKKKYGLNEHFEVKWTKVSPAKLDFYLSLIDFFYESSLHFRCIVAKNKKLLNHEAFNQTYDDWYYKMYYLLLNKMVDPMEEYSVYIDIKDTNGGKKTKILKEILNYSLYSFYQTCIRKVQIVKSNEVELLQLCDLLIGCIGYYNRFMSDNQISLSDRSDAKIQMCEYLQSKTNRPLNQNIPLNETKLNIFIWEPKH